MMAVIFNARPAEGRRESLHEGGQPPSLQVRRDEESIARGRDHLARRKMQRAGWAGLFRDDRLRVAQVVRDHGMNDRAGARADLRARND
jgi:hypothetical protein